MNSNSFGFRLACALVITPIALSLAILLAPLMVIAFGCYVAWSMMQED